MEQVESWVWLFSIGLFFFGVATGFALGRVNDTFWRRNQHLEKELDEINKEFQTYRNEVTHHFVISAQLINNMSKSYRAVYDHFATGSQHLCSASMSKALDFNRQRALLESATQDLLPPIQSTRLPANHDDGSTGSGAVNSGGAGPSAASILGENHDEEDLDHPAAAPQFEHGYEIETVPPRLAEPANDEHANVAEGGAQAKPAIHGAGGFSRVTTDSITHEPVIALDSLDELEAVLQSQSFPETPSLSDLISVAEETAEQEGFRMDAPAITARMPDETSGTAEPGAHKPKRRRKKNNADAALLLNAEARPNKTVSRTGTTGVAKRSGKSKKADKPATDKQEPKKTPGKTSGAQDDPRDDWDLKGMSHAAV